MAMLSRFVGVLTLFCNNALAKVEKVHAIFENRAGINQSHHFHKIGIGISRSMETSDTTNTLVVGLELLFQSLCH